MMTLDAFKSIEIQSKTDNIPYVEKLIDEICEENKVNEDYYGNILIAITEAVNNAIMHGNSNDPQKKVKIDVETSQDSLVFKVSDQGIGFDYDSLPDPTEPENIDKPNGRGVFLMKHLADTVAFHDMGKTVELSFKISAN
jgi:serine/threonine-protein kinase RsbW